MPTRTLEIIIQGNDADALRSFGRVERGAGRLGDRLDREGKRVHGFATVSSKGFSRIGAAATGMQVVAGGALAVMAKSFVTTASNINESLTKNRVLFGQYADDVDAFSKRSATAFGISRASALEYTGVFGNLFRALDVSRQKSAGMSVSLTKLAADMASFNNTSIDDALEAIRSGLVGETEPLRRFGVNMNDAQLRVQALKLGLTDTTKNVLTPYQRSMAAVSLITKQTAAAHGDFDRTSGGLANQTRILRARLSDVAGELGGRLLPFALKGTKALNGLIQETQQGRGPVAALARQVRNVADAISDVVGWFRRHRTATTVLMSVTVGLTTAFVAYKVGVIAATIATRTMAVAVGILNVVLRANPVGLVVTALTALAAGLVVAYKRSATFRRIVDGAFAAVKDAVMAYVNVVRVYLLPVFQKILSAGQKVANVIGKIGGALGSVGGAAKDAAGFLSPFGEGLGKVGASMGTPGLGGGSLMGADPDLAPFAGIGARFGTHVSSGIRPGAVTSSGNQSYHATGDAIDLAGPAGGMMNTFRALKRGFGSRLRELIYTPGGTGIKDGRPYRYTGQVASDHYDHVHVAYTGPFGDGIGQAAQAARAAGFRGQALINAVAIAGAESGYRTGAQNLTYPDHSIGLWQINQLAHHNRYGSDSALKNALTNAKAAWEVSGHGRNFGPWSTWPTAAAAYIGRARAAVAGLSGGGSRAVGGGGSGTAGTKIGTVGMGGIGTPATGLGPGRSAGGFLTGAPGYELGVAIAQRGQARAQAKDNLPSLIKALAEERALKRRRLKLIRKVLRGRISKKRRLRLVGEETQLIGEIGDLTESIKEYKADQAGGATTISRAEELDAGVDTSAAGGGDTGGGGAAEPDPNTAALVALTTQIALNQQNIMALMRSQNTAIPAALAAMVDGQIGGPIGLAFQTVGSAGKVAAY